MNTNQENFIKPIPSVKKVFKSLLRADFKVQWRQRRALLMSFVVPLVFLISWKSLIPVIGAANVLSICISIGLPAVGLMAYSLTVARDREKGIFQRLRAAPIPTWAIMTSRILVQAAVIGAMTLLTIILARFIDKIFISWDSALLMIVAALFGGLSFLALGQLVVAVISSSEAVNAATRLIYFPLAIIGAIGQIGVFGKTVQNIVEWSPFGTTKAKLAASITPASIINDNTSFGRS